MAKPILVANWKNNPKSLSEARALLRGYVRDSRIFRKVSFFVAPPFTYFESVNDKVSNFAGLAAQDISSLSPGNYTGYVTAEILKSFGVKLAIVGHSERRRLGESSFDVSNKVKISIKSGIAPLVCVGELVRDEDGEYLSFLGEQIKSSLAGLGKKDAGKIALAYEPVWAIGSESKGAIEVKDLAETIIFIKKILTDLFGRVVADKVPVLYGGSVDQGNARTLFRETGIRGFLVGRASLDSKNFKEIANSLIKK